MQRVYVYDKCGKSVCACVLGNATKVMTPFFVNNLRLSNKEPVRQESLFRSAHTRLSRDSLSSEELEKQTEN